MAQLKVGETFPTVILDQLGGGQLSLPWDLTGSFGVVLLYRGSWCPYCTAQLVAFEKRVDRLSRLGARVVALSVDGEEVTAEMAAQNRISFPIGYGANPQLLAEAVGAYLTGEPPYLEMAGFMLSPEGEVLVAAYSSNYLARLVPDEVEEFLEQIQNERLRHLL